MTNELAHYSEIMEWCRESEKGQRSNNSRYVKAGISKSDESERSCLNCHGIVPKDRFSPFCSNACMNSWDKGGQERYRQMENAKKDPKILLQQYSQVMDYAREHSH